MFEDARSVLLVVIGCSLCVAAVVGADEFDSARARMLSEIRETVDYTRAETGVVQLEEQVVSALLRVPRHEFVPPDLRSRAYANRPLAIGHGQTISQPYIVALMTDLLDLDSDSIVLEVGTGSGYQAAVLAELSEHVYSMEIVVPLAESARARLERLGYDNVSMRVADGYYGWQEHAPYDAIIVTAAASHVPPPLVAQLRPGAKLVIPIGAEFVVQQLLLIERDAKGSVSTRQILPVRFVPLTGEH